MAKSIGDAGWSASIGMLASIGDWYDYQVEKVKRWYPSSKRCSACGADMKAIPLHVHDWQCPVCDLVHNRDVKTQSQWLQPLRHQHLESIYCGSHGKSRLGTACKA